MKYGIVAVAMGFFLPLTAEAQATLVYDARGKVQNVVRQGPSGSIIYDRRGDIVSVVRNRDAGVSVILRTGPRAVRSMGTSLRGGVGDEQ